MSQRTIIELNNSNYCKITVEDENGVKTNKNVSFETLMSLMSASTTEDYFDNSSANVHVSDILPGDHMISTIQVKEIYSSKSKWYVLLREQVPVDMKLKNKVYRKVAMPRTLYAIKVCNNKCVSLRICCVQNGPITMDTPIYRYPYSNVFDTKSVCLGGNSISDFELNDLSNIVMIPEMFLSMINNNDGYYGSNSSDFNYDELLELMENASFDNKILVKSYNTPTYKNFLNNLR